MSIRKIFSLFFMFTFALLAQKIPLVYAVENTCSGCTKHPLLTVDQLAVIQNLPEPFAWADGRGRISNFSDWRYRSDTYPSFILIFLIRKNCNSN